MPELRLGPLLRYVDEDTATVWVETDSPCEVEIRCGTSAEGTRESVRGPGGSARTWRVCGHHYAVVTVVGLEPGTDTPYRVLLDGDEVWPLPGSELPPSTIRTREPDGRGTLRVAFGSCRWAARPAASTHGPVGPDVLEALAQRVRSGGERPDVLLLLGDQVYADETSAAMRETLSRERDISEPPWSQVADYGEYAELYYESWLAPWVRWLLSTVPSCMIFDDHDVIDDWNTSETWQRDIRATSWWRERILGGLTSYWVYQHLGNLSPGQLAEDPLFTAVREADDGTQLLRDFAERADADPSTAHWSYRRDFGRVRLLMADTRAARVLDEKQRAMLDEEEMAWLREQAMEPGCDHLLVGSSLPWLLPPAIHDAEAWNAALCAGARGTAWARRGEKLRQAGDLEHWAAFPESFRELAELAARAGSGEGAPATVCVLSGDVHHAYLAEPSFEPPHFSRQPDSRVLQLTCSPMHNSIPASMRLGFRFGWSRLGRWIGKALARHGHVARPPLSWRRSGGPWFGNHLMTLSLQDRSAMLGMDRAYAAETEADGSSRLSRVIERELTNPR